MADRDRPIKPLPERKEAFATREAAKGKGIYERPSKTPSETEAPPLGTGPLNRHGMPRLPIGQRAVPNWPVLDLGATPALDLASWRLRIDGLVGRAVELTWSDFMALPQVDEESDFHCVTTWSRYDMRFTGVRFRDLIAAAAAPRAGASRTSSSPRTITIRRAASPTRRTSRWPTPWSPTFSSFTPGKGSRFRASTGGRAAW